MLVTEEVLKIYLDTKIKATEMIIAKEGMPRDTKERAEMLLRVYKDIKRVAFGGEKKINRQFQKNTLTPEDIKRMTATAATKLKENKEGNK